MRDQRKYSFNQGLAGLWKSLVVIPLAAAEWESEGGFELTNSWQGWVWGGEGTLLRPPVPPTCRLSAPCGPASDELATGAHQSSAKE